MSMSESEKSVPLPAPISLTLEEALQVAGGTVFAASSVVHDYIINGVPALRWLNPANVNPGTQQLDVGQFVAHGG